MRLLLDTHLLLWSTVRPGLLSAAGKALIENPENEVIFSVVSIWEIAIKNAKGYVDFRVEPRSFRQDLLQLRLTELILSGEHTVAVAGLPPIHKDPFDRILIAQAMVEGITLLTADPKIAQYSGSIQLV
jgi:PIN domain nuclease of toxin-antitoxin system